MAILDFLWRGYICLRPPYGFDVVECFKQAEAEVCNRTMIVRRSHDETDQLALTLCFRAQVEPL